MRKGGMQQIYKEAQRMRLQGVEGRERERGEPQMEKEVRGAGDVRRGRTHTGAA